MEASHRLIIALDVPTVTEAENIVSQIGASASFYKIGHQLAFAGGLELARDLAADGKQIFLDMKLLDIDNTVARGVENIVRMGVAMTTIHAYPKAMKAAVAAARGSDLCLLAVTVLTSMDNADLSEAGYFAGTAQSHVKRRATMAAEIGMGGIVASAKEARMVRKAVGTDMAIVTPGIRPAGSSAGDQKRVMTPGDAILAGATHLVVGRPIVAAEDRKAATMQIISEIEKVQLGE